MISLIHLNRFSEGILNRGILRHRNTGYKRLITILSVQHKI